MKKAVFILQSLKFIKYLHVIVHIGQNVQVFWFKNKISNILPKNKVYMSIIEISAPYNIAKSFCNKSRFFYTTLFIQNWKTYTYY